MHGQTRLTYDKTTYVGIGMHACMHASEAPLGRISAEDFHHEIVLDFQSLVARLCSEQMAAVRQDLAHDRRATVL